ncbi:MAG: hypothetical protein WD278_02460 [Pirellulales bacterium]
MNWVGRRENNRRGAILLVVMVCLSVAIALAASLLKAGLMEHTLLVEQEHEAQARRLAESGVERAAARLRADPDYTGETWEVSTTALGGPSPGVVEIRVESMPDEPVVQVTAQADYPAGRAGRARRVKQIKVNVTSPGDER